MELDALRFMVLIVLDQQMRNRKRSEDNIFFNPIVTEILQMNIQTRDE